MRLPHLITLFMICLLCSCNFFTADKQSVQPKKVPGDTFDDVEFQKLREQRDSLLEMRQKKPKSKDLDTLKPVQA